MRTLQQYLQGLPIEFIDQLEKFGIIKDFSEQTEILREGQYVKYVPLVLEGAVKVFTRHEDKELLLYYIESGESCIMSFNAGLKSTASKVFAVADKKSLLLLLPVEKLNEWVKSFPSLNELFFNLYDQRYASLLDTINHLLYSRLDQRLYNYLQETARQKNSKIINIRHRQMAAELGTAREVISRVMKKLEQEGKVKQLQGGIEIL
ncbi:MAG: Crp/Fnr family transcriptional regulator [Chitinophagaceae bacterium]|nr:Crp/Fnr family transcriptional regulator [Chitinophagaceae bacterium]MBK8785053.1 Crp/Fnr family transcriptional regulator [Chitinophagaceae bacterium]